MACPPPSRPSPGSSQPLVPCSDLDHLKTPCSNPFVPVASTQAPPLLETLATPGSPPAAPLLPEELVPRTPLATCSPWWLCSPGSSLSSHWRETGQDARCAQGGMWPAQGQAGLWEGGGVLGYEVPLWCPVELWAWVWRGGSSSRGELPAGCPWSLPPFSQGLGALLKTNWILFIPL